MKRLAPLLLCSIVIAVAQADNLVQVYQQAYKSDPTFAQAQSTWHSQQMNLPIARAGYLTQVGVTGATGWNYNSGPITNNLGQDESSWQNSFGLTLSQPIFNVATWEQIKGAGATVKSATATYLAAEQTLMQQTASAYFSVLQAYDNLRYTIANKKAVWQQYQTSHQQYIVGLIAVTDEYDAQSRYDEVVAKQIAAQNNLDIQLENLRAITGRNYSTLSGIAVQLPLFTPQPNNIDQWVKVATKQNYNIKAQRYAEIAAMDTIKQEAAGGYPSLALTGSGTKTFTNFPQSQDVIQTQANLGLALTYNPIQGGLVIASTKQAEYNYVTAAGALEQTYRQTVEQTRSSFLSVLSYISQVQADKAAIVSAAKALAATEAGMKVGTRTMVDVLNGLSALYLAQQAYSNDQYDYLNNLIALKQAAGTLSANDLVQINSWLKKPISFPETTGVIDTPSGANDGLSSIEKPTPVAVTSAIKNQKQKTLQTNSQQIVSAPNTAFVQDADQNTTTTPQALPAPAPASGKNSALPMPG